MRNRIDTITAGNVTFGDGSRAGDTVHGGPAPTPTKAEQRQRAEQVFVIHGRDPQVRIALFEYVRALGLQPMEWEHLVAGTGSTSPSLQQVVTRAAREAQAVIAVLTPDDVVSLHPTLLEDGDPADEKGACQARPNVYLELGMALALIPDRTIVVEVGRMRRPADLGGLNHVRMDERGDWLNKVAGRLQEAGCPVNRNGSDWLNTAPFRGLAARTRSAPDCHFFE